MVKLMCKCENEDGLVKTFTNVPQRPLQTIITANVVHAHDSCGVL